MNRTMVSLVALLLLFGTSVATAQTPQRPAGAQRPPPAAGNGELRGTVLDAETNGPVGSASVAVWGGAPAELIAGTLTRPDGAFRLEGLRPGAYEVRISHLGYTAQTVAVTLDPAAPRENLGQVRLAPSAVALEGVEVTTQRSQIIMAPDRNTYRASDIAPAGGTAGDVLRAVPSVDVDAEGKVSFRGNENVAVQINGRPTPLRGAQLGAYLQQLPAGMLERIEVVPNPSARYDPEGMAGIINIVMKENVDLGISGGLTLTAASTERYSASGNMGYQRGPLTLFGSYGHNADERSLWGINNRERHQALQSAAAIVNQDIAGETFFGGHNLNATAEYKLSGRDLAFGGVMLNVRRNGEESLSATTELTGAGAQFDRYDRIRESEAEGFMMDYTLGLKRTFQPQRHELSTEFRFNRSEEEDRTELWRQAPGSNGAGRLESELNDVDALASRATAQLDYTRTFETGTKLETGYKGEGRWLDRDYLNLVDPQGTGTFTPSDRSNTFSFDEQVHAVYGVLSHGVGRFELQGGLRAEQASREFVLGAGESFPYDYGSLFPSALASYKLSDASTAKLSYSRRIRRPGTQELNPFPNFFDVNNVFFGNPELSPEYTDAYELSYQRTGQLGSFQVSPFYRRTNNVIRILIDTADEFEGREVTSVSFTNLDTSDSWGTDVNGSLRIGRRFNGFGSFNIFKMVTDGTNAETSISSDAVNWMFRLNGTAQLTPALTAQAMYMYRAPMEIETGRFSGMQMVNLSLRQRLNQRASVSVRVADPFNTMGMRIEAGDDNITQITERRFGMRAAFLTFQYNFGQAPRMRQPRQQEPQQEPQTGFPQ